MSYKGKLPEGWVVKRIGEIMDFVGGGTPSKSDKSYWNGEIPWASVKDVKGKFLESTQDSISETGLINSSSQLAMPGEIIMITRISPGKTTIAKIKTAINQDLKIIKPKIEIKNLFIHYLFEAIEKEIIKKSSGTTVLGIRLETLKDIEIPLPPLAEQHEIVAKIEELFSELDKGVEALKTAREQLKVYRQSVLKHAFEGKFTNTDVKDGELPEGWDVKKLGEISFVTKLAGFEFTKFVKYSETGEIPVIRAQNVSRSGFIERNFLYVDRETMEILPRSRVFGGEILMVFVGAGLGNVGIVPSNKEFFLGPNVAKIALNQGYDNNFYYYFLSSYLGFGNITGMSKATAQGSISMGNIREVLVPIIALHEQHQIVQEIECRLNVCEKLEETIADGLAKAETLRQSILKQAFEGKLVSQKKEVLTTTIPANLYFFQLQVLGYLTYFSRQEGIRHGQMTAAKYAYLLDRIFGVKTYFNYERWHLGPFPPEIKKVLNNRQYFSSAGNSIDVRNTERLFKYDNPEKEKIENGILTLAEIFASFKESERAHKTELLATVCKVIEDIQSTEFNKVWDSMAEWKIDLKNSLYKNKAEKFTEAETKSCLDFVVKRRWSEKLINYISI